MGSLIDLSTVPVPNAITEIDYEAIRAATLADLKARLAAVGIDFDVDRIETDPLVINEEARAYRELLVLQKINDAVRAVLLASATGADLDNLAADFNLVRRNGETDAQLRFRRQLAPEGYAVAGPKDAYRFHALEAAPSLKQAEAIKGNDNVVTLVLLSGDGNGAVDADTVITVQEALSPEARRPLTDSLYVRSATIVETAISVRIEIGSGPDAATIKARALAGLQAFAISRHAIGAPLYLDGIVGAARKAEPVERVVVVSPVADIDPGAFGAVHVTDISVEVVRV